MHIAELRSLTYGIPVLAILVLLCWCETSPGDDVIFADDFEAGLSSQWNVTGISRDDFRIIDGGLELRVQPGKLSDVTPMLAVAIPAQESDVLIASVEVTIPDRFTEPSELAGLFLTADGKLEFGAKKQNIDGYLLFSPGQPEFIGQPGEEGDSDKYTVRYWPAANVSGPLRIVVRNDFAYFQVGPSPKGDYLSLFHSAIEKGRKQRGFALVAAGGPDKGAHWVRFDNFRIMRVK